MALNRPWDETPLAKVMHILYIYIYSLIKSGISVPSEINLVSDKAYV